MIDPTLKRCPFCGSAEIDIERSCSGEIEVQCLGECGALIVAPTREQAIVLWNRRSTTAPDAGRVEAAVEAYDRARVATHGGDYAIQGMSAANKKSIAPMFSAALAAADAHDAAAGIVRQAWQPIETAPKDGTRILLCEGDQPTEACTGEWLVGAWRDMGDFGCNGFEDYAPTQWMPLPPRPNAELSPPDDGGDAHEPCPDEEVEF